MNNLGFWKKLEKPIMVLAPMADVTDCAFRQIINKYGKPDVFWTEFVSADGLSHPVAREKLLIDLKYDKNEHPIVAQIFGSKPENIKIAAALCRELGFDGIDINMGCPERNIQKQGSCAALIQDPKLAREVIRAAKEGAGGLPVSVKTRIGYNKNEIGSASSGWIYELLSEDLAVLTVHLRTKKEMSDVPAHWEVMRRIVEIRDEMKKETLIIGNGDVMDMEEGKKKCIETGCDGIMFGRAIFGNPWLFRREIVPKETVERDGVITRNFSAKKYPYSLGIISLRERLSVMIEHTKLFEKMLGEHKNFSIMKKHYKAYVNGFEGAKELRMKLMEAENSSQIETITNDFLSKV